MEQARHTDKCIQKCEKWFGTSESHLTCEQGAAYCWCMAYCWGTVYTNLCAVAHIFNTLTGYFVSHIDVRESLLVEIRSWILSEFQICMSYKSLNNFGFCILYYQQPLSNKLQILMFYVHELQSRYLQSRSMYSWYKCSYVFTSTWYWH